MSDRPERLSRGAFAVFRPIATRWSDNDVYGHVNNAQYYSYFDTAVNGWLVEKGLLTLATSAVVGLVVETGCTYFESVAFPEPLEAGIAVTRLGRSSVRYAVAIFTNGANNTTQTIALSPGTYFFAVSAVDSSGNESALSNEVTKTVL